MFQSDLQDFYHYKTGEYTVATNVFNNLRSKFYIQCGKHFIKIGD